VLISASLLISRLQAAKRKSTLVRAFQEYGRLQKTLFILRYLQSEEYRRRIDRQINRASRRTPCAGASSSPTRARSGAATAEGQVNQAT